jgi:hypothetical protein
VLAVPWGCLSVSKYAARAQLVHVQLQESCGSLGVCSYTITITIRLGQRVDNAMCSKQATVSVEYTGVVN